MFPSLQAFVADTVMFGSDQALQTFFGGLYSILCSLAPVSL